MSEYITPYGDQFNAAQILAAEQIETEALEIVEARYGSGYPHYLGGEDGGLAYHNRHHSEAVQTGAIRMSEALGLTPAETAIGSMAAAAHDIVQRKSRGVMEQESADWLAAEMQRRGIFPARAVEIGTLAILGTEPTFEDNRLVGQVASQLEYPSRSAEMVAKSVACADLGELHSAQGPLLGHELFKEINGVAPAGEPPMEKLIGFQRGQVGLVESYQYPLAEGERVFGGLRGKVAAYSAKLLGQLERGEITSWQQLIAQDQAFMRAVQ